MGKHSLKICVRLLAGSVGLVSLLTFLWHVFDVSLWQRPEISMSGSLCFFLTSLALQILVQKLPEEDEKIRQSTELAVNKIQAVATLEAAKLESLAAIVTKLKKET